MKRVLFQTHPGLTYNPHHPYFWKEPEFQEALRGRGYQMVFDGKLDDCDYVIFFDATAVGRWKVSLRGYLKLAAKLAIKRNNDGFRDLYKEAVRKGMRPKLVLMLHEGEVPVPENFSPRLHRMFDTILTWNDDLVDNRKFFLFRLPTALPWPEIQPVAFDQKKLLVCILSNYYTRRRTCLGPVRRAAIKYFENRWPRDFDLYGNKWNRPVTRLQRLIPAMTPIYKSYRGYLDEAEKAATFSRYRFSLTYENCASQPGWIANRLFESMRSDNVPIFLGGTNVGELVDQGAFVDRRQFRDDRDLGDFIQSVTASRYEEYRSAMRAFIAGPRFVPFLSTSLAHRIADVLDLRSDSAARDRERA